ncbi:hypothetical protein BRADI_1g30468v3 [Brachypodium distachyon]|uniref:Uncharacterized protein n=1 Tax=Brachypodium distachyon TaxID=15368 RepID=A0A2K2DM31_BRADI|nr:hypothetical protein BRADI_1g30468v3 [Brachypodium distachyon]
MWTLSKEHDAELGDTPQLDIPPPLKKRKRKNLDIPPICAARVSGRRSRRWEEPAAAGECDIQLTGHAAAAAFLRHASVWSRGPATATTVSAPPGPSDGVRTGRGTERDLIEFMERDCHSTSFLISIPQTC